MVVKHQWANIFRYLGKDNEIYYMNTILSTLPTIILLNSDCMER